MALEFTPQQLARRSQLYHQLSQLTAAGITLLKALEMQSRSPVSASFRQPLSRWHDAIAAGESFPESLERLGTWMPVFDKAMLNAGAQSGRLPANLEMLAEQYAERSRTMKQLMSDSAYPFFLFHFAILIGPFPELFLNGKMLPYLAKTFGILLPVYAVIFIIIYAARGEHGAKWRAIIESIFQGVPLIGSAQRNLALARLCAAMEGLLSAGINIIEAWDLAAEASGSPALRSAVARMKPLVVAGRPPSEVLPSFHIFPETFTHLYATGEVSGTLEDSLRRLHILFRDEGTAKLRAFSMCLPKIVYFLIVLLIAWRVVSFWMGYFQKISDATNF